MTSGRGRIVLASASRSRTDILRGALIPCDIRPADLDESILKNTFETEGRAAADCAVALAEAKAAQISSVDRQAWVIGADQMLECDGRLVR